MAQIRGLLLDVDGVLHVGMSPVPGAIETLHWLAQKGYRVCFVTNTTTVSRATLTYNLRAIGLPVSEEFLVTAPVATAAYVREQYAGKRCWLLTKGDTALDFADIELVEERAEVVIIGGAEELLSYEAMNKAFRMLMNGAELLATHVNLYWRAPDGLQLDSGPYVRALELASGKQATVLGKPNQAFFERGLTTLGTAAAETLMIGDDLVNDVQGAQRAGLRAMLVCSGKHDRNSPQMEYVRPDAILSSIADVPDWLSTR